MFEVESAGFISQIAKEPLLLNWNKGASEQQSTSLSRSKQVRVQYETASTLDLEYASLVAHHILRKLACQST